MTTEMNRSNAYRKVRALLAKTEAAGATNGEALSALETAINIVRKHGLDVDRIVWPAAPAGYEWPGKPGAEKPVKVQPKAKPAANATKARARKPKADRPKRVTKGDQIIAMLQRPGGASIAEITKAMSILPHTARAYISVEGRKRGLKVTLADGRYTATA